MRNKFFALRGSFASITFLCGVALVLVACGGESTPAEPGQTLARVDGEEITVIQLNDELGRSRINPDQVEQAKKQLLESMIDRQLMVEEAKRNKLDRAPNVMRAIERSKMQIIAQSYMQTALSQIEEPTQAEIDQFYQENPELFAQRKQYSFSFISFASEILNDDFNAVIDSANSLGDVAKWLDKHQVSYRSDEMVRVTTDIPPPVVTRLRDAKVGERFLVHENATGSTMLVSVDNMEPAPLAAEDVQSQIAQHLLNTKRRDTAQAAIAQLRAAADIEYLHEEANTATAKVTVDSSLPVAAGETPSEMSLMSQPDDDAGSDNRLLQDDSIERAISGLK